MSREAILERFTRQQLQGETIAAIETSTSVFHAAASFVVDRTKPSREQSLALTALEEAKFWANQGLALHGAPEVIPAPGVSPLALSIEDYDNVHVATVGGYLAKLLITLLREEEGFSGKRPLGNSGWLGVIEEALGTDDLTELEAAITGALR